MSREIKFRGLYKNEWVFGSLITRTVNGQTDFLIENCDYNDFQQYEIDVKSIGRFTTQRDKKLNDLYHGDIVLVPSGTCTALKIKDPETGEELTAYKPNPPETRIIFDEGIAFFLGIPSDKRYSGVFDYGRDRHAFLLEKIGNIYEHPHLLENGIISPEKTTEP